MPKKGQIKTHCKWGHNYTPENTYLMGGIRQCKACRARRSSTWAKQNKEHNARKTALWRSRHPEKKIAGYRRSNLRRYKMSLGEYEAMSVAQAGVCAICSEPCPTGKRLAVDHDHVSGRVRGLLCASCNNGLGRFRDDVDRLQRAADYLARANFDARVRKCQ